ncbi:MAG: ribosome maturation factor RimP [Bacteroidota bacterium]
MDLQKRIEEIASEYLESDLHFLAEVSLSHQKTEGHRKVLVLLDGDQGVSIEDCAKLSRKIGARIEEENIFGSAYTLEVSSPGVDYPLKSQRQFAKNIGRSIRVRTKNGEDTKGELLACDDQSVTLVLKKKNKKQQVTEEVNIKLEEIEKAIVLVSFK